MENCPFTDDFPTKTSIYNEFSIAMLNNQMVPIKIIFFSQQIVSLSDVQIPMLHAEIAILSDSEITILQGKSTSFPEKMPI